MTIQLALVHPAWGRPLFIDGSGRPVYLGRGADGTDDDGEADGDSGTEGDEGDDTDGDKDEKDKKDKEPGSEADAEVYRRKMKLADKRAADAEQRLKALEDKDKDALEVATRKLQEAEAKNVELNDKLKEQSLQNAFLLVNEHTWVDPGDALDLARRRGFLDDVQDEDGVVDDKLLKRKLAEFAKAKPNMVQASKEEEAPGVKTGQTPGSGRKKDPAVADEAALRARYSALRR